MVVASTWMCSGETDPSNGLTFVVWLLFILVETFRSLCELQKRKWLWTLPSFCVNLWNSQLYAKEKQFSQGVIFQARPACALMLHTFPVCWFLHQERPSWDFPGGPVVRTSPSSAGGASSIPGGRWRPHMPPGQTKQKQYYNKFIKDFKMAHIKNILKKNNPKWMYILPFNSYCCHPEQRLGMHGPLSTCIRTHQRKFPRKSTRLQSRLH